MLPSALFVGRSCGPVHAGIRTIWALSIFVTSLKPKGELAVARMGQFVVIRDEFKSFDSAGLAPASHLEEP